MEAASKLATCTAPVNIAVIKYCKLAINIFHEIEIKILTSSGGKRDENLILPINSSLSVTLNQDEVHVTIKSCTGVCASINVFYPPPLALAEGGGGEGVQN